MRSFLAVLLVSVFVNTQVFAQPPAADSREEIAKLSPRSLIEVKTTEGGKIRGCIVSRTDSDFSVRDDKGTATHNIAYQQAVSVSRVGTHTKRNWIILGVVAGVVALAMIAARIASHPVGAIAI